MPPFLLVDLTEREREELGRNVSHPMANNFVNYGLLISRPSAMCIN